MNKSYQEIMQEWSDKFGGLIQWKTRPGKAINQMWRILNISRNSHTSYLTDDTLVPSYIRTQVSFFNKLKSYDQYMIASSALSEYEVTLKDASDMALTGWEELTGKQVMDETPFVEFAGRFSLRRANEQLRKVIADDPTGLGVALLLRQYVEDYISEHAFTFQEIIAPNKSTENLFVGYSKIKASLSSCNLSSAIENFIGNCDSAIKFYKPSVDEEELSKITNNAFPLLLNAKKAFKAFSKYTVSRGSISPNTQLKLQEQIFVFDSLQDLIERSSDMPNGFALSLIRTARVTDSFFCMMVKHDGMIYMVADKARYGNPLTEDYMAVRNQRYNAQRMEGSYMPYDMLSLAYTDNGKYVDTEGTDLVLSEGGIRTLGHIRSMHPDQILWFTFLLEEAKTHFMGQEAPSHRELGYFSSASLEHPLALDNKSSSTKKNLPSTYVVSTGIETNKAKQVSRAKMEAYCPELKKRTYLNGWMEEMFDSMIEEEHLYVPPEVITENGDTLLLEESPKNEKPDLSRVNTNGMDYFAKQKIVERVVELKTLPSTLFGSSMEIQEQADYIARANKARVIEKLVKRDYEENETKMQDWIAKKIAKNLPNFIDDLLSCNHQRFFIIQHAKEMALSGLGSRNQDLTRQVHVKRLSLEERWVDIYRKPEPSPLAKALKIRRKKERTARCYLNNTIEAEYRFYLNVNCVYDLVNVTGIPIEKMPKQLQNWGLLSKNEASHLDKTYDPMQDVSNPWNQMKVTLVVPISKEALSDTRKRLGIKGRFIRPIDFFENDSSWLKVNEDFKDTSEYKEFEETGLSRTRYSSNHKPSFSFYTQE